MEQIFVLPEFDQLINGYDRDFMEYSCSWVANKLKECTDEVELECFKHTIKSLLTEHVSDLDQFFHLTHVADGLSVDDTFSASKRYEDHVIRACSIVWAIFEASGQE